VGQPIFIEFRRELRVSNRKLVSGGSAGTPVHAGSFLRDRRIILDLELLRDRQEQERILAHEIFHFVWWKLERERRDEYRSLLEREIRLHIRGEMGWSAEWRKKALKAGDVRLGDRRWREYCCESFCDTASIELLSLTKHPEVTLPRKARDLRRRWLEENLWRRRLKI